MRAGRVSAEQLFEVIDLRVRELSAARKRNEELEQKLGGGGGPLKFDESFSMTSDEQRQEARAGAVQAAPT